MFEHDPREITVRYPAICKQTGKPIAKGDKAVYYPIGKSLYHLESDQAQSFREWRDDIEIGGWAHVQA